jgi:hypothetical protein
MHRISLVVALLAFASTLIQWGFITVGYETSNPPLLAFQSGAKANNRPRLYTGTDSSAQTDGFVTDGYNRGMKTGDLLWYYTTTDNVVSLYRVKRATATGRVTLTATKFEPREVLTSDRIFYIRTDGSDSNNGSADDAANAFLTLQGAVDYVNQHIDGAGFDVTLKLAAGTFVGPTIIYQIPPGLQVLVIEGDASTPSNVTLQSTNSEPVVFLSRPGTNVYLLGVRLLNTGGGVGVHAADESYLELGNNVYDNASYHIWIGPNAACYVASNYTVTAGGSGHMLVHGNSSIEFYSITVTLTGTPVFTSSFVDVDDGAVLQSGAVTYSGSAIGPRWNVSLGGLIALGGADPDTYFPGNAVGTYDFLADTHAIKGAGNALILSRTAIPTGGMAGAGYRFSTTTNFGIFFGSGAPTLSAAKGSLYLRSDGTGTGDRAYINTNGRTTWTALTTAG